MKVGLTGGIGCGKSTVVEFFRQSGWRTIESDEVVRDLLAQNVEVQQQLFSRWGEDSLRADDGSINRKAIAARVFANTEELKWLEKLLHPLVRKVWESSIEQEPTALWLVELPLLFEKRLETRFDLTVCVASHPDVVEHRMVARGYTGAQIDQRRERQMSLQKKMERADHLISNSGSLEFLKRQTTRLIEQITKR